MWLRRSTPYIACMWYMWYMWYIIWGYLLQKELTEIAKDHASGVTVCVMSEQSLHKLQGCLKGGILGP
jgi:hypothetical protein